MKAIILAAGVGSRLFGDDYAQLPKCLLTFEGRTLLDRHVETLITLGVDELFMVLGHRKKLIREAAEASAEAHGRPGFVRHVYNPYYRGGPVVSLWMAREILNSGDDVLFMDADVLYDPSILKALVDCENPNALLMDQDYEEGPEPVKVCLSGGKIIDFGKRVRADWEQAGEWPGFMKLGPKMAPLMADALQVYMDEARLELPYEPAMRDVLLGPGEGQFAVVDITGKPWIEIDFPEDLKRAESEILPRIQG